MTVYSLEEGGIQVGGPIPDHPLSVFEWTVWVNEMWHHRRVIAPVHGVRRGQWCGCGHFHGSSERCGGY